MLWLLQKGREYLFYLFLFVLPWQTRWIAYDPRFHGDIWEYHRVSLYGWDILFVILVVLYWKELKQGFEKLVSSQSLVLVAFIVLVTAAFFTGSWARDSSLALYWTSRLLEVGTLALLVQVAKPKFTVVCGALASAGVLQAVWALAQFGTQATFANKWLGAADHPLTLGGTSVVLTQTGRWLRAYAGQVHPNVLGALLAVTIVATLYLFVSRGWKNHSWIVLVLVAVQTVALVVTFSRTAWLAVVLSLVVWWFVVQAEQRTLVRVATLVVVVSSLATMFLVRDSVLARVTAQGRLETQSVEERVAATRESGGILRHTWLQGVGMGNYTLEVESREPGHRSFYYQPVHNLFLLVFSELGVVGILAFLALLGFAAYRVPRASWPFLAVLVPGMFLDHYWWTTASMVALGALVVRISRQHYERS